MKPGNLSQIVGQTPLIRLASLSEITGCEIFGKAEFLNPGGSVKDRTALGIIQKAEVEKKLQRGFTIVEGTAGNTGIGLATLASQRGYKCLIVMPNNQAPEKYKTLEALGAQLVTVAPCPFADQNHFYHTARRLSEQDPNSFWANQFENTANFEYHFQTTGPEIWQDMGGDIDAFVSAVGTGGTLAGVSRCLKEKKSSIHIRLADPFGSGLYSYVKTGQIASTGSSITEGIGIMRITANFQKAIVDEAVQVSDQQMISMLYHLARNDGLLVGTSAALNVYAAFQYAMEHKNQGLKIVTILCDSGLRYQSRIYNQQFLNDKGLVIKPLLEQYFASN